MRREELMKNPISIHLLASVSIFLIILGQGLQSWREFSSVRQGLTAILVFIWLVHLCKTFILLYRYRYLHYLSGRMGYKGAFKMVAIITILIAILILDQFINRKLVTKLGIEESELGKKYVNKLHKYGERILYWTSFIVMIIE